MAEEYVKAMCRRCCWHGAVWFLESGPSNEEWSSVTCSMCEGRGWVPLSVNEPAKKGGQVSE